MKQFLRGVRSILFVPFANADCDAYYAKAKARFNEMGFECESLHLSHDPRGTVLTAEACFVGGGNTFLLLKKLQELDCISALKEAFSRGMKYMGASAGSNIACRSIHTTNDMPIVYPSSFDAVNILPFNLNPHFLDKTQHPPGFNGETREQRIAEFHQQNTAAVLGIREGTWLHVQTDSSRAVVDVVLHGAHGGVVFFKDQEPRALDSSADGGISVKFIMQ